MSLIGTIRDTDGNIASIDGLGTLKTYIPSQLVGESFNGSASVDPNFWTTTVTGSGSITQDGEVFVDTGTTADSTAQLDSIRLARKITGTTNQFRAIGHFATDPQANNIRTLGPYDDDNGAFFKLDGTTFKIVTRSGGVDTEVSSGSFNGDVTTYVLDTNIHRFVIEYSAFVCKFFIDGALIHKVFATTEVWTKALTLPIRLENNNSGGNTTDNQMHFQLLTILRLGQLRSAKSTDYQAGTTAGKVLKYGAGALEGLAISGVAQNSVITLYDNTAASGQILWTSGAMGSQTQPFSVPFYNLDFFHGLTLVISGASSNVTAIYE